MYALQVFTVLAHHPTPLAITALRYCLRYIKSTLEIVKLFHTNSSDLTLVAFTDEEWATNEWIRKSVIGNVTFMGKSLMSAYSRKRKRFTTQSVASELT